MTDIFLDPYLLALPRPTQTRDELEHYLDALLHWQSLLGQQGLRFLKSDRADAVLYQDATSPTWNHVSAAIQECGALHIQERDVIDVVEQFLRSSATVEAVLELEVFAVESVQVDPPSLLGGRPDHFVTHLCDLLMLAGLQQLSDHPATSQHLATKTSKPPTGVMNFDGHALWRRAGRGEQDKAIHGSLRLSATASELESQLDPVEFWQEGNFDGALSLYLRVSQTDSYPSSSRRAQAFRFASGFKDSLNHCDFSRDPPKIKRLLRALAETIMGLRMKDVHDLRTGSGGNCPQRRRGRDLAWRRDIDREYHLHYWSGTQGFEFVQVGVHNDDNI